jgi:hypothetical protein
LIRQLNGTNPLLRKAAGAMRRVDRAIFGRPFGRYFEVLEREVSSCDSLLDVGCGERSPISFFAKRLASTPLNPPSQRAALNRFMTSTAA